MATITTVIPEITDYPQIGDTHEVFRQKADTAWTDLSNAIPKINEWSTQANDVRSEINGMRETVLSATGSADAARDSAISAKNEAIEAKDLALSTKAYMESYVVPTESTYNPTTIDSKIRMAQVLTLTESI